MAFRATADRNLRRLMASLKISLLFVDGDRAVDRASRVAPWLTVPLPEGFTREIISVDVSPSDGATGVELPAGESPGVVRVAPPPSPGRGAAIRAAIPHVNGIITVIVGAEAALDPTDLAGFIEPILSGRADAVFASRFQSSGPSAVPVVARAINLLYGARYTDSAAGAKAFRTDALRTILLRADGSEIDIELAAKVQRNRFAVVEFPVEGITAPSVELGPSTARSVSTLRGLATAVRHRFGSDYADLVKVALDALECAPRFNRWMYESIRPWLGQRVAELGAGKGNLSEFIRQHGQVLLSDFREDYLDGLRRRFADVPALRYAKIDMACADDYVILREFAPDTIVFLNVLEHIEDDQLVLNRLREAMPSGGRVVVLVPYNMQLFSEYDRTAGHFRRYQHGELEAKMAAAGLRVLRQKFFNKVGALAWYVANTLGGRRKLTPAQMRTYNFLTPLFQRIEPLLPTSGLSTIVVAEKP
jgi:SAM-dependent methyltransferase